ncbi:MAG: TolC family protein [Chitinophagaceae bacterium]|jgi:OMF family outer membrane factor|nr:TolC family protein [Chitinophagaceae bacterium]NMD29681.1 TolC family protein [Bacteroidota bacterium]MBK7088403.1 TolC family protein [Chitinophagaceae bacterium]MBK8930202.1 TolC family protein [Chitinophagaceae bacterium]QQS62385.1 MAG: TolC family protein [Chitinophagaceae bacterium]
MKLVNIRKQFLVLLLTVTGFTAVQAQVWSLQQCIDTAQVYNKALQMSRNNIAISQQRKMEAKANLIPKISANADYKYFTDLPTQLMPASIFGGPAGAFKETQFGVPHNINANLQLTMPLYNPQVFGAIQTAKIATELSDLQLQKTEEQIYFDISNLYYNGQLLLRQLAFIDSNIVNTSRLLKNMQLLKEQLMAKGADVSKVQLQKKQLETQKESVTSKYEQVINALKFAMGISLDQNMEIEQEILYEKSNEYSSTPTTEIRLANTQSKLLLSELNTLKKSKLPSVSLFGTYGKTGFGYDKQPNDFLKFYPIGFAGIQISYPLFNGTVTQRKISQKKLEIRNSELQVQLVAEQNAMQTHNAKRQMAVAQKSIETNRSQIKLAQTIYEQTVLQQKQGTASLTDVLLADTALREAQQNYLSAVVDYLKADLELKKLTNQIKIGN